jgi:pilus assembly protein CpaC
MFPWIFSPPRATVVAVLVGCTFGAPVQADLVAGAAPCGSSGSAPPLRVVLPLGKSTNLALREPVRLRALGNPAVAQVVQMGPKTLYLLGVGAGTTNLFLQGANGRCSIVDLTVQTDTESLRAMLRENLPEAHDIKVGAVGDTAVLSGTVPDGVVAEQAVNLARQYQASVRAPGGADKGKDTGGAKPDVINLLQVAAPQQVMLEVKVAEVSKNLLSQLGISASLSGGIGNVSLHLASKLLNLANVSSVLTLNGGRGAISAEKNDGLVKVLAEPNLVAVSGQQAQFLAGGKVYLPVPQSNGNITLQQESYGVGLVFTPTVLRQGLINLKVMPEVSELSQTGMTVRLGDQSMTLPVITLRRAETTVQVYDGQSFAIGGLLKNNTAGTVKGLPGLMDLPILGALFRSTDYRNERTELVFIVTPRLVRGLSAPPPLPTDGFGRVDGNKVLLDGNFEGTPPAPSSAPSGATQTSRTPAGKETVQ